MYDTYVTIQGRLTADPAVRYTRDGTPFAAFGVAHTARRQVRDRPGTYTDTPPSFYEVTAYRALGANVLASLEKGQPVTVFGRQRVNVFQRRDGCKGASVAIEAYAVGHDLGHGTASYSKARGQYPADGRPTQPGGREAFDVQDLGDPEHAAYVVDDGPGGGHGTVEVTDGEAGAPSPADTGPLVRDGAEDAA